MFTSRFVVLALLTFLAGANAGCATCEETLEVDGVAAYKLVSSSVDSKNGFTVCNYADKKGGKVACEYHTDSGLYEGGDDLCPRLSRMDTYGC
ncbi:hypothetical protein DEU56DRAFT_827562 [Suillus clintonianus]|uniref:uncharacterized protein n=1 Tax=Suillus clintonianus TaxID=1904413 RepID=UPI001B86F70A|nr:uncharacterized protein DEU56DRAFT_827562 [Suillus clintonianus]KAG2124383.1 hypothetical protein DEU56DRAFT_827562 [Suillus clintonianus]